MIRSPADRERIPLLARAQADPHAIALRDDRRVWTWLELAGLTLRTAGGLRAAGGLERPVGVCAHNSGEVVVVHAAGVLGQVTVVPVNHHLKADEVRYMLSDSGAQLVLAGPETIDLVEAAVDGLDGIEVLAWRSPGRVTDFATWAAATEPWVPDPDGVPAPTLMYTSGTTGRPKAAVPPSRVAGPSVLANCLSRKISEGPHLVVGPLYHGGPVNGSLHVLAGVPVVVLDRFDASTALAAIERHSIGSTTMVPTHFRRLLSLPESERRAADLSSLEIVTHTGAPCPIELKEAMLDWFGPVLRDRYGGTESGTLCEIDAVEWYDHKGSVGRARTDTEVVAISESGDLLPAGVVGTLHFRHPSREVPVYLGVPDPEARTDGWYTLGELGCVDPDGYVFLTDRSSDVVLSGGVNVYPAEAERVLLSDPCLVDVVCLGVPHPDLGEELIALAVLVPDAQPCTEADVLTRCRSLLSHVKCPRRVEFVAEIERNAMGKVNRRNLRDRYREGDADAVGPTEA